MTEQGDYVVIDRPCVKVWFTYSAPADAKKAVKKPKRLSDMVEKAKKAGQRKLL